MNITTREHAEILGIADAWDREMAKPSRIIPLIGDAVADHFADAGKKAKRPKGPNGQNATELAYERRYLEPMAIDQISFAYEFTGNRRKEYGLPITARRKYTPDYTCEWMDHDGGVRIVIEVKGGYFNNPRCEKLYQAAKVRLDVAAEKHMAVFLLAVKDGKSWRVRRVPGLGDAIDVPAAVLAGLGVSGG